MSVLKVKNGNQWDIVPAIKGDQGDPAADESITDDMLVTDGIKTEIEWLWGNQLTDSREGEILHADDAYTAPAADISVDGKSTQVTTTGKNLFDKSAVTSNRYINQSGGLSAWNAASASDYIPVEPNTSYTLHFDASPGNNRIAFYSQADEAEFISPTVYFTTTNTTFTTPEGANYLRFSCYTTVLNSAQLESGTDATAYEPYTGGKPSPNPEYPQEIVSTDAPELTTAGKNILSLTAWELDDNSGITIVEDGTAFRIGQQSYQELKNRYYLPVAASYILSFDYETVALLNENARLYLLVRKTDGTSAVSSYSIMLVAIGHKERVTIAIPPSAGYLTFGQWGQSGTIIVRNFQLELGSTATEYEPYLGNTAPLLPDGYSLRSLPDGTKDELHLSYLRPSKREGWAWYSRELVKRVGHIDDMSELTWGKSTTYIAFYTHITGIDLEMTTETVLRCTGYKVLPNKTINQIGNMEDKSITQRRTYDTLHVMDNDYLDADTFKNAITGMKVDYPLATPTTETLDPIELPIMPSRTVNVWSDPATNLKMTYIQDTNLIIESLEATIADIATS